MELEGIVKSVGQTTQISASFAKRELVITTEASSKYPQTIMVEFHQDKVNLLDQVQPNASVKIAFNIRGREWANPQGVVKYFTTIQGWKLDVVGGQQQSPQPVQQVQQPQAVQQPQQAYQQQPPVIQPAPIAGAPVPPESDLPF